mgnify:CR=1 FL=1
MLILPGPDNTGYILYICQRWGSLRKSLYVEINMFVVFMKIKEEGERTKQPPNPFLSV